MRWAACLAPCCSRSSNNVLSNASKAGPATACNLVPASQSATPLAVANEQCLANVSFQATQLPADTRLGQPQGIGSLGQGQVTGDLEEKTYVLVTVDHWPGPLEELR